MNSRNQQPARTAAVPVHRGSQAKPAASFGAAVYQPHAPNAALLIDFDNVTMGIRSDLGNELRNLLGSDIIKGKVAVQRAYADWRRYPQYVVALTEASIDLIFAAAIGSSKKNATDIRLAVDAIELVFTRPEIGTFILLSGDSDFSSMVLKLKEYGKYVIGVGIRESSSDLLVMNCDEYYSYSALAGLVKSSEEEVVRMDPWELVSEALRRMKRNGDVMRSDRLKQVMVEIDNSFDEKDLGMPKFSRFVQEAAARGLLSLTKLENGQLEVGVPDEAAAAAVAPAAATPAPTREERPDRGRGRRGRGRDRERNQRERTAQPPSAAQPSAEPAVVAGAEPAEQPSAEKQAPAEMTGERLTRDESLDLVKRAVERATNGDREASVRASEARGIARELLGRDSETLSERFFARILRDAHDANVIDLRKRGDDYEISLAVAAEPIAEQLKSAEQPGPRAEGAGARSAAGAQSLRQGIRHRGARPGARGGELPPELLTLGVVADERTEEPEVKPEIPEEAAQPAPAAKSAAKKRRTRRTGARKASTVSSGDAAKKTGRAAGAAEPDDSGDGTTEQAPAAKKTRRRTRAKKAAAKQSES
jgi:uncharacterized protein (TIGR00288 family)